MFINRIKLLKICWFFAFVVVILGDQSRQFCMAHSFDNSPTNHESRCVEFQTHSDPNPQASNSADEDLIDAYDILGVFVGGVIGDFDELPPVQFPKTGSGSQPSTGYPILVQSNGMIDLPLVDPISVEGLTIEKALEKIRKAYTTPESNPILQKTARIIVTQMQSESLEAKKQYPKPDYKVGPFDILGVHIEGITGRADELLPLHFASPEEGVIPSSGYPLLVLSNGTISIPLLDPIEVSGLTLEQIETAIQKAYVEAKIISRPESPDDPSNGLGQPNQSQPESPKTKLEELGDPSGESLDSLLPIDIDIEVENQFQFMHRNTVITVTLMRPRQTDEYTPLDRNQRK